MRIVSGDEFVALTANGRENRMDLSAYGGRSYKCVCGYAHAMYQESALRELPGMRLVMACPDGAGVNCVRIRGWIRIRIETEFGALANK
jgi:hypothetical protein